MRPEYPSKNTLADPIAALAKQEGANPTRLSEVTAYRISKPEPRKPTSFDAHIVFVGQGRKRGYLGAEVYHYDAGNYFVMSAPIPMECDLIGRKGEPLLTVMVRIDHAVLGELLLDMGDDTPSAVSVLPRAVYASPLTAPVEVAAFRLLQCLSSELDCRVLGKQLLREVLYRVIRADQGNVLRTIAMRHSHFGQISRVMRRLRFDYAKATDVVSLAREAAMSVSTFHENFKAITSTSPLQYLKTVRLNKARMLMVQDGYTASAAAAAVGYESSSQFSREFKRFFSVSPIEDAMKVRIRSDELTCEKP